MRQRSIYSTRIIHGRRHVNWLRGCRFSPTVLLIRSSTQNCLSFVWPLTWQYGRKYSSHCLQCFRKSQTSRPTDLMSSKQHTGMHDLGSKGQRVKTSSWGHSLTFRCARGVFMHVSIDLKQTFKAKKHTNKDKLNLTVFNWKHKSLHNATYCTYTHK